MRTNLIILLAACGTLILPSFLTAQNSSRSSQQFIESSSPLKNGGSVTTRSNFGTRSKNVTTISGQPQSRTPSPNSNRQAQSVLRVPQTPSALNSNAYPYPATTQPRGSFGNSAIRYSNNGVAGGGIRTANASTMQVPTLGIVPNRRTTFRTAQNCDCRGVNTTTAFQSGSAALEAPSLNIEVPGETVGTLQTNPGLSYQNPGIGVPQFNAPRSGWWTPFVSGSGTYPPLIRLRNMSPGTYLGQGIIGQPTAYVDGQPIRNLLRYISP